ncbi:density-regulated protein homolog [Ptychodera flava]|uniref:density-regulated protein homolog n=1 Tax=Ptychodera flava TaxID=63121 RepID=UPI00396A3302
MAAAEVEVAAAGLDAEDTTPDNTDEVTSQQKEQQEPEVKSTQPKEPEPKPEPEPVSYPIKVIYCGECTMPLEYCEFHPDYEKCKKWLEKNLPEQFEAMMRLRGDEDETSSEKKKQKRGGRGIIKTRKKTAPQRITISRMQRNKRKYVTVVKGLSTCGRFC